MITAGPDQTVIREQILAGWAKRASFTDRQRHQMLGSPDALDAAVAAFAGIAAVRHGLPVDVPIDGRIAVLDEDQRV